MRAGAFAGTATLSILLGACAVQPPVAETPPMTPPPAIRPAMRIPPPVPSPDPLPEPAPEPRFEQVGIASWYGRFHHGKKTASGEPYNMNALTAAHRTLPMKTRVRVTNLKNGKSVEVRINDRGPYAKGRIIDLSAKAASILDMQRAGLAEVMVEVLEPETQTAAD